MLDKKKSCRAPSVFSVKKAMQTYARQGAFYFFSKQITRLQARLFIN
jgi:hypothetical protein